MYCSFEDAWKDNNLTSSQNNMLSSDYQQYNSYNDISNTIIPQQQIQTQANNTQQQTTPQIETFVGNTNQYSCNDIINKVLSCPTCKSILLNKLKQSQENNSISLNKIFSKSIFNKNQDTLIIIITVVIVILLIDFIIQAIKK